jgi:hypothetical protein
MGCPSLAGCIAVAATPQQFSGGKIGQRVIISSFPAS